MTTRQHTQPERERRTDPLATVYRGAALLHLAREARQDAVRARERARELRGEILRVQLPRARSCAVRARRLLEMHLPDELAAMLPDAKLVASELVTNAFLHGEGAIELRLLRRDKRLRVEVIDGGTGAEIRIADRAADGGRGLLIVDQLARRWGAYEGTTHVWADLRLPATPVTPTDPSGP